GRIAAIPVVVALLWTGTPRASYVAALVYTGAAITDWIDGWLARKFGQVSVIGKFLDPLAAKLLVMATLVVMLPLIRLSAWIVIVLLGRELAISGLRSIASSEGVVISASQSGKWKTAFQMVGILCLMVHYTYDVDYGFFTLRLSFHAMGYWIVMMSLVI